MKTSAETMQFVAEQLTACDVGLITYRKMFGEYGVYLNGQIFALVCDDRLFMKVKHLEESVIDKLFGNREKPFPGAGEYSEASQWLEDVPALEQRLRTVITTLPASKPKKPRAAKKSALKSSKPSTNS